METIIEFHRDLATLPKPEIFTLAKFYDYDRSYNDLLWMIAIRHGRQHAQMRGIISQVPVLESLAKNMTVEQVLNYANVNRFSKAHRNIMLREAKVNPNIITQLNRERRWDILEQVLYNHNLDVDSIEELSLADMPIQNLEAVGRLTSLKKLDLKNLPVTSLNGLQSLKDLLSLTVVNCPVTDIRPITDLTQIIRLYLINTGITNLSGIEKLKSLVDLRIETSPIDDISSLSNLKKLRFLSLYKTYITEIPLRNLQKLEVLNISETGVSDISPLLNLKNLRKVVANDTRIRNLVELENRGVEVI